jgi:RNA polymerase sigma factor (sigma-70 family)
MDEEQLFLANEKLIWLYIKGKKFPIQEKEDILQHIRIGLLKAIRSYKPETGYALSTLAMRCMDNEYKQYMRKKNAAGRKGTALSLHDKVDGDSETEFMDSLIAPGNIEDDVILDHMLSKLTDKERNLLMLFRDKNREEIAKELGCQGSNVSKLKKRLINKIVGDEMKPIIVPLDRTDVDKRVIRKGR